MSNLDKSVIEELAKKHGLSYAVCEAALENAHGDVKEAEETYIKYVKMSLEMRDIEKELYILHCMLPVSSDELDDDAYFEKLVVVTLAYSAQEAYDQMVKSYPDRIMPSIGQVRIENYPLNETGIVYDSHFDNDDNL